MAESTHLFALAESLGGVESLIEVPAAMTHLSTASSPWPWTPAWCACRSGLSRSMICWRIWSRRWDEPLGDKGSGRRVVLDRFENFSRAFERCIRFR